MADTKDHVLVVFLRSWQNYNSGDRATFAPARAKFLVDKEIAKPGKRGSILSRKKKTVTPTMEPGSRVRFFIPKEGDAMGRVVRDDPKVETIRVAYDGDELDISRGELTFVSPPEPEKPEGSSGAAESEADADANAGAGSEDPPSGANASPGDGERGGDGTQPGDATPNA